MQPSETVTQPEDVSAVDTHTMYRHIVVALDGSEDAERVLPFVEALARCFGSEITLLRAVTPIEEALMGDAIARTLVHARNSHSASIDLSQYNAVGYLAAAQERVKAEGFTVHIDCPEGEHAKAIVERARELEADLIAMTTHGYGGLKRAFLGSVADEVMRTAHCPVLLIRLEA